MRNGEFSVIAGLVVISIICGSFIIGCIIGIYKKEKKKYNEEMRNS